MRKWLYKKDVEPTIFTGDAIQEALSNGWKERPIEDKSENVIDAKIVEKKRVLKPKPKREVEDDK